MSSTQKITTRVQLASLVAVSVLLLLHVLKLPVVLYDEGLVLEGAHRLMNGQFPHADFWTIYPTGQYWVLSKLFENFGETLMISRAADIGIKTLISLVLCLITTRAQVNAWPSLLVGAAAATWLSYIGIPSYPGFPAILLISIAIYIWLDHECRRPIFQGILVGSCFAAAAAFRHDLAAYGFIGSLSGWLLIKREIPKGPDRPLVFGIFLGLMFFGLLILTWWLSHMPAATLFEQLIATPAQVIPTYRKTPWPPVTELRTLPVWVTPLLVLASAMASVTTPMAKAPSWVRLVHAMSTGAAAVSLAQISARKDLSHITPSLVLLLPAMAVLITTLNASPAVIKGLRLHSMMARALLLGSMLILLRPAVKVGMETVSAFRTTWHVRSERIGLASLSPPDEQLLQWLESIPRNSQIYVGVTDHNNFSGNEPAFYFLSGKLCPTYFHELHPGASDTPSSQLKIVHDIEIAQPEFLLLLNSPPDQGPQKQGNEKPPIINTYISSNYATAGTVGRYQIMSRRPHAAAQGIETRP